MLYKTLMTIFTTFFLIFFLLFFSFLFKSYSLMMLILGLEFTSLLLIFFSIENFFNLSFFVYTFMVMIFLSIESIFLLFLFIFSNQFFKKDYLNFFYDF